MTKFYITLLIYYFLLISCNSVSKVKNDNEYTLLSVRNLKSYELLTFSNLNDTILTVVNKKAKRICVIEKINKIDGLSKYSRTSELEDGDYKILFIYKEKSINGDLDVTVGSKSPGQKAEYVNSYKSFPYLIDECKQ